MTRTSMMTGVAIAALALSPTLALAQDSSSQDQPAPDAQVAPQTGAGGAADTSSDMGAGGDAAGSGAVSEAPATADGIMGAETDEDAADVTGSFPSADDETSGDAAQDGTAQDGLVDSDGAAAPTAGNRGPLAGVIATEEGTVTRAGPVPGAVDGTSAQSGMAESGDDGALTQQGADLGELAREADGATIGATDPMGDDAMTDDGRMAGQMGQGSSPSQGAQMLLDLEEYGEAFFERGFRQGYVRGLQEGRMRGERAAMTRMQRDRQMRERAGRTGMQQRRGQAMDPQGGAMAPQQGAGSGQGGPQFIIVPQGTDMQELMRQLQQMQGN